MSAGLELVLNTHGIAILVAKRDSWRGSRAFNVRDIQRIPA
jgi:hypothetical protein